MTNKGNLIEARVTDSNCDCCKKCMIYFTVKEKNSIIFSVYWGRLQNVRDTYLLGLIDRIDTGADTVLYHPIKKKSRLLLNTMLFMGGSRIEICRKAFINLYLMSNKVVQRLNKLREINQSPVEMRGKHKNRGNILDPEIICKIHDDIFSFFLRIIICFPFSCSIRTCKKDKFS